MPYTRISPAAHGREAILYAKGGDHQKAHNGKEQRNLLIGGVNLLPDGVMPYEDQMQQYWNLASSRNKTQVQRVIGSFSPKELPPDDPNSALKAMGIAQDYFKEEYPDRQVAIFIQDDGVGGKIHFHALVNNVSMTDHKGCTDDQRHFSHVKETFNKVAERYIELDFGYSEKDKTTQHERTMRQKNAEGAGLYIWKDDLKDRIRTAMDETKSRSEYFGRLSENGVEGEHHTSYKYGEYITYELADISGFDGKVPLNLKARSYKLGADFGYEALDARIRENNMGKKPAKAAGPEPTPKRTRHVKSAEEKAREEEAAKFAKWAKENGYNFYDNTRLNKMNLDVYELARKNYEIFLEEQEKLKNQPPEPEQEIEEEVQVTEPEETTEIEVPEIEAEIEDEPSEFEPGFSASDKSEDEDGAEDDEPEDEGESEETAKLRRRNQQLQEQLISDAEQMERDAALQDDLDNLFGKDF